MNYQDQLMSSETFKAVSKGLASWIPILYSRAYYEGLNGSGDSNPFHPSFQEWADWEAGSEEAKRRYDLDGKD